MGQLKQKPFFGLLSITISLLLGLMGWIIGAYIGGNFAVDFTFFGLRGYEASGVIGSTIGALVGLLYGPFRLIRRK